ncbi:hypothetical protein IFM89_031241 [Coptis chinensis]|uniref:MINDY deubiquitinase domain-containing protein n=1 Tax=Coptis chinensis TaxID=261450 RepID=A0A835IVP4_9MAGN|nr:hypothetical protein IFM89_031241 [Coptis chinensis]
MEVDFNNDELSEVFGPDKGSRTRGISSNKSKKQLQRTDIAKALLQQASSSSNSKLKGEMNEMKSFLSNVMGVLKAVKNNGTSTTQQPSWPNTKLKMDDFEFTRECAIFDLLDIPLYHDWIVDPQLPLNLSLSEGRLHSSHARFYCKHQVVQVYMHAASDTVQTIFEQPLTSARKVANVGSKKAKPNMGSGPSTYQILSPREARPRSSGLPVSKSSWYQTRSTTPGPGPDCIGSAFNVKGVMQCPNCKKVEKGQWLFSNGTRSCPELSLEDWAHDEDLYDPSYSEIVLNPGMWYSYFANWAKVIFSSILSPQTTHELKEEMNEMKSSLANVMVSGLKSELTWALNTLTLLSFIEKEEVRRDAIPLAKIPGLLDAVLQIVDDWRDIALPNELKRTPRIMLSRVVGALYNLSKSRWIAVKLASERWAVVGFPKVIKAPHPQTEVRRKASNDLGEPRSRPTK